MPPLRELLRLVLQAFLLALGLAGLLWLAGLRPFWTTLLICAIFSSVLWLGFRLLRSVLAVPMDSRRSPLRVALASTLRMAGIYTCLLLLCVELLHLILGWNLTANLPYALLTYLIGFTITVSINGFYLTQSLVMAERRRAEAEAERLRQAQELEAARTLQVGLLPRQAPTHPGAIMAWAMHTASEVGGDTFDVFEDGAQVLHGAFGDATGHGMRAGMVVVAVKTLFRMGTGNPIEDLHHVSRGVKALGLPNTAMALTLWRLEGRTLTLAHAGMPAPLLWRAAEKRVEILPLKAPPVGQLQHPLVATCQRELAPGDLLLFASDGLGECFGPDDQMLGYDRVPQLLERFARRGPQGVVDGLWKEAQAHAAHRPLEDDLSLFVLQIV